jgi:hypothetical protein
LEIKDTNKIFIVGCDECAKVCKCGGEEEVLELKKILKKKKKKITGYLVSSEACHIPLLKKEFRTKKKKIMDADCIVSLCCGAGTQAVSSFYEKEVHPALDTVFLGTVKRFGSFLQYCSLCGNCVLSKTGGICPITRCAKTLINGPCGGGKQGNCEVYPENKCCWVLIYEKLKSLKKISSLKEVNLPKDHSKTNVCSSLSLNET